MMKLLDWWYQGQSGGLYPILQQACSSWERNAISYYYAHKGCLLKADATFSGTNLVVPPDVKGELNPNQNIYVAMCLGVPVEALGSLLCIWNLIAFAYSAMHEYYIFVFAFQK